MPPAIPLTARFAPRSNVMIRELDGESVLLDLGSGHYFGLNATGQRIWTLLAGGETLAAALDALESEFAAPREALAHDLLELVAALERDGLVERRD